MVEHSLASNVVVPLVPRAPGPESLDPAPGVPPWGVLVVDADEEVHRTTELAMRDVLVDGRALHFVHASSAEAALAALRGEPGIAVAMLEVLMQSPEAALRLARLLRGGPGRQALRIILRTAGPGDAPAIGTLRDDDIDDCLAKAELTPTRLYGSVAAAIRAHAQVVELERHRNELAALSAQLREAHAAERAQAAARLAAEAAAREAREDTDRVVAQRTSELSRAVRELEAFNRRVSHDLRGPLDSLAGLSGLVQRELDHADPANLRRWLALMETQARRLAQRVAELMQLASVASREMQRGPANLGHLVHEALESLRPSQLRRSEVELHVGLLPELEVDAGLLRQAFANLLANAFKFTRERSSPRIEVNAWREGPGWHFVVRDNGIGFDARRARELFRPFARLHDASYEGTGVGLAVAARAIERHGGRVWAESQPGEGARFHFTLPDRAC